MTHGPTRILLIEPLPADVRWLEIVLTEARINHQLLRFSSAIEFLSQARPDDDSLRVDLVVMAFGLPCLSPTEAIARLRALPQFAQVPIAVTIAFERETAFVHGATHFLLKPITPEQLHRVIDPAPHLPGGSEFRRTADVWKRFIAELRQSGSHFGAAESLILDSWQRSWDGAVDRYGPVEFRQIGGHELVRRRTRNQRLLNVARTRIDEGSHSISALQHVLYVTDRDGIVLYSRGSDALMRAFGLLPGFDWSERAMGTNGAGTALASNRPVAVIGPEHWHIAFRYAACLGAPIRDASGATVGAVDLSTPVDDCRPEQMEFVIRLARQMEADLQPQSSVTP